MFFLGCETFSDLKKVIFSLTENYFGLTKSFNTLESEENIFQKMFYTESNEAKDLTNQTNPEGHLKEKGKRNKLKKRKENKKKKKRLNVI